MATAFFYIGVAAVGALSIARIDERGGDPDWSSFSVILVMACAAALMRLHLPGVDRAISLSFPFAFAAVIEQPPLAAWVLLSIVELLELGLDQEGSKRKRLSVATLLVFRVSLAAICVAVSSTVFRGSAAALGAGWAIAAALAAAAYFSVMSALDSLRLSLAGGRYPWTVWSERHFWTSPLYVLAPLGVVVVKLIIEAETYGDVLLGVGLVGAAYWYLHSYFPKLHDRQEHAQKLAEIRGRALETLAVAIEAKDGSTAGHLRRVRRHSTRLGRKLRCSPKEIRTLQLAAVLHDVGKVGVPDSILTKPTRLTDEEFEQIATHATIGAEIIDSMDFVEPVGEVVLSHHEHWDGSGYPRALRAEEIPRLSRILTVADCFDALVSERPYRDALPVEEALDLMRRQRGKIFDPLILDSFLEILPSYLDEIKKELEKESKTPRRRFTLERKVRQTWVDKGSELTLAARSAGLQKLSRRPELMLAFYEALNALGADLDFQRSFRTALGVIAKACGAEIGAVFVLDRTREGYTLMAAEGMPAHAAGRLTIPAGEGLLARVAELRVPMIGDAPPGPLTSGFAERSLGAVRCSIVAPLLASDRVIGAAALCANKAGAFAEHHGLLLDLLTEKLAATVVSSGRLRRMHIDAQTDSVTSLPNARASFQRLEQEVNRAEREGRTLGVLFMDLNGLKPVNDSYGHHAGDRLLSAVAERLQKSLRSYDFVGRIGGDEFLALLPGISDEHLARSAETLKQHISSVPVELADGVKTRALISVGAALYPHDSTDADELICLSDRRMYEDKERFRKSAMDAPGAESDAARAAKA